LTDVNEILFNAVFIVVYTLTGDEAKTFIKKTVNCESHALSMFFAHQVFFFEKKFYQSTDFYQENNSYL